jgi:hypothetical protein
MSRILLIAFTILALLLSVSTAVAQDDGIRIVTDEDTDIPVPIFTDGRLNAADMGAPVVIYYTWEKKPVFDEFGRQVWGDQGGLFFEDVVTGIDVLSVNLDTGFVEGALHVGLNDIQTMVDDAGGVDCCLAEKGPISLHYSPSGWFWVQAPEREGKTYTFQWEGFDF